MKATPGYSALTALGSRIQRTLGPGTGSYAMANLLRSLSTFAALPVLLVIMGQREVGVVTLVMPLLWLSQSLLTLGSANSITRLAAGDADGVGRVTVYLWAGSSVLAALCTLVMAPFADLALGEDGAAVLVPLAVAACGQCGIALATAALRGGEHIQAAVRAMFVAAIVPVVTGLGFAALASDASAATYLWGLGVGSAISATLGAVWCVRLMPASLARSGASAWRTARRSVSMGLPTVPQYGAAFLADFVVRRTVLDVASAEQVATLGIAMAGAGLCLNLMRSISNSWAPRIYKAESDSAQDVAQLARLTLVSGIMLHVSLTAACWVIEAFAPAQYDFEGMTACGWLAGAAAVANAPVIVATALVFRSERTAHLAWIGPASAFAAAGLAFALMSVGGWIYAATTMTLAQILQALAFRWVHPVTKTHRAYLCTLMKSTWWLGATAALVASYSLW